MDTCLRCFSYACLFALSAGQFLTASLIIWSINNWLVVSNIFYFHPYLGKIPILTNIFQRGWNHQLDKHHFLLFKLLVLVCLLFVHLNLQRRRRGDQGVDPFLFLWNTNWGRGRFAWWAFHATEASRNTKTLGIKCLRHWQLSQIWRAYDWRTVMDNIFGTHLFFLWNNVKCIYCSWLRLLVWHYKPRTFFCSVFVLQFASSFMRFQEFSSRFFSLWVSQNHRWAIWYIHALCWIRASILMHMFFKSPICLIHPMHKKYVKSTRNRSLPA